ERCCTRSNGFPPPPGRAPARRRAAGPGRIVWPARRRYARPATVSRRPRRGARGAPAATEPVATVRGAPPPERGQLQAAWRGAMEAARDAAAEGRTAPAGALP